MIKDGGFHHFAEVASIRANHFSSNTGDIRESDVLNFPSVFDEFRVTG